MGMPLILSMRFTLSMLTTSILTAMRIATTTAAEREVSTARLSRMSRMARIRTHEHQSAGCFYMASADALSLLSGFRRPSLQASPLNIQSLSLYLHGHMVNSMAQSLNFFLTAKVIRWSAGMHNFVRAVISY